jgi:subtilisin
MGRRMLLASVCVVGLLAAPVAPAAAGPPARVEVIVALDDGVRDAEAAATDLARRADARSVVVYRHAVHGFSASVPVGRLRGLEEDPRVAYVNESLPVSVAAQTAPTGVRRIDADDVHRLDPAVTGAGVRVAILDTGIAAHPDLVIETATSKDCTNSSSGYDDRQGHGTHVAGTVAALDNSIGVVGVAPSATLSAVKVLNDSGSGSEITILCGLDHLLELRAQGTPVHVANLSLSGTLSWSGLSCGSSVESALFNAFCEVVASGTTVVVAAGNDGWDASRSFPASHPSVITVSALEDRNGEANLPSCTGRGPFRTCDDVFASFSNHGPLIDVMAPGVAIQSTVPGGYGSKSGTSMAAPHVAGVAALLLETDATLAPADVLSRLRTTGECPGLTENTADANCTSGSWQGDPDGIPEPLVNARRAVTADLPGDDPGGDPGGDPGDDPDDDPDIDGPAIALSVDHYKRQGVKYAALSWTSEVGNVEVLRNGTRIDTTTDATYLDSTGRGGGTYTYQVCQIEIDEPTCSNAETVSY